MTPESFVIRIRSTIVQRNVSIYKDLFESTPPQSAADPYWKRALTLYRSLDEDNRHILLEIMRQVTVDTVSTLFGILDGISPLDGPLEGFTLTSTEDGKTINGCLQDIFLEAEGT